MVPHSIPLNAPLRTLNALHAITLGGLALLGAAASLLALPDSSSFDGSYFYAALFNLFCFGLVVPLGFAAYQLRWVRGIGSGRSQIAAGLLLSAIMIFGSSYFSIGLSFNTAVRLFLGQEPNDAVPIIYAALILLAQLLGLFTLVALIRPLNTRARAGAIVGGLAVTLALQALLALLMTVPALLRSSVAMGVEAQLVYLGPALGAFVRSLVFSPFGANGSGGELWPIGATVLLTLPIAVLTLRAGLALLRGEQLRRAHAVALGLLIVLASISPFSGDRLRLELPSLFAGAALPALILGLAMVTLVLRQRVARLSIAAVGVLAVAVRFYDVVVSMTWLSDDQLARFINGLADLFAPERLTGTASALVSFAVMIVVLLAAVRAREASPDA
jgi:hypothetical protein